MELKKIAYGFIIIAMFVVVIISAILIALEAKKQRQKQKKEQEKKEEEVAFVSGFVKGEVKDKPEEKQQPEPSPYGGTAGFTAQEFFSVFFPDPTESVINALNFADSMKDTIELTSYLGKKVFKKETLISMFEVFVKSKEGIKEFSTFVSGRIKLGAKPNSSFFKITKLTNMFKSSQKVARAVMMFKQLTSFINGVKLFLKGQTLLIKSFLSRLGMKGSSFVVKSANRIASTQLARGAITSAKNIKNSAIVTKVTKAAVKTATVVSKTTVKAASAGAKTGVNVAKGVSKALNPFFWPLLIFDISNIVADLSDAGGYMNIGYKSVYDSMKNIIINELDQGLSDQGLTYPFIYGPEINQDEIFDVIQNMVDISYENDKDDVNDLTYKMRKKIKEDLSSGVLTYEEMMFDEKKIAEYNMYVDHEKLFKDEYSRLCEIGNGKIVSIDDKFSVYDKKQKKVHKAPVSSDMYYTNSVQSCERLFSEISNSDPSYTSFSYRDYGINHELIDINKLNDETFICIYEPNKFIYTKKTIESPLKFVDMDLEGLKILMNKVIQLKNGTFVGLSQYNLYTCEKFGPTSIWKLENTNDKIISICQLDNEKFLIIKDNFLLYSKETLTSNSVQINQIKTELISITQNNDKTFLVIGKDNVIYTLKDLNSSLVSTSKNSVIHGFQMKDSTYIFLGVDFQIYVKTDLSDALLSPYEQMDPNCYLMKKSSDLNDDDDTDVYIKNNNPIKKMGVCSFKKENCNAKWPIPEDDDAYIYHEYKNNIADGSCVLADSRMRSYCESDEIMINYNGADKSNAYNMEEGTCLVNRDYCLKKGVSWNADKKDCEITGWQNFFEFVTGSSFVRKINSCESKRKSDENNKKMKNEGKAVDIQCSPGEKLDIYDGSEYIDRRYGNYVEKGACYYDTCPTGYTEMPVDESKNDPERRIKCVKDGIPPGNWILEDPGNDKDYLTVKKYYSTVGLNGIPSGCASGYEYGDGLCYINPDPNTKQFSSAGLYRDKCPDPSRDTWLPASETCHYYRSGYWYKSSCEKDNPGKICELLPWGGVNYYFAKCENGYRNSNVDNNYCVADGYKSMWVTGVGINKCPDDKEYHDGLCYPKCADGYERRWSDKEQCVSSCPSNQNNYTYDENKDQDGQTITTHTGKTRKECEQICNDTSDCKGIISYTKSGDSFSRGNCYTVKGFPSTYTKNGSVVGTRKLADVEYAYRKDVEYGTFPMNLGKNEDGSDKKKESNKTRKECEELCTDKNACSGIVSYTTDSNDKGDCKLFSDTSIVFNRKGPYVAKKNEYGARYFFYKDKCLKPTVSIFKGNVNDVGVCPADFPYKVDDGCGRNLSACFKDPKDIVD